MKIIKKTSEMQRFIEQLKHRGKKIGFVPTMGALHNGHLSLVEISRRKSDITIVSIFVNPTQFAPNEDLASYPRDLPGDIKKLEEAGADCVFAPAAAEIYDEPSEFWVLCDSPLTKTLEAATRPSHFKGVTTVVSKLFNIVRPNIAVFGKKDYQQFVIIKKMVSELRYPIKIYGGKLIRDYDGLALSSRNKYLDSKQRKSALNLYHTLKSIKASVKNGELDSHSLLTAAKKRLKNIEQFKLDYIQICERKTLTPVPVVTKGKSVILMAAFVGNVRLIDNMEI